MASDGRHRARSSLGAHFDAAVADQYEAELGVKEDNDDEEYDEVVRISSFASLLFAVA